MKKIRLTVEEQNVIKQQGDLFGIFFEDLNRAADGGLYGELVRNRSFEFDRTDCEGYHSMTAWELVQRGDSVAAAHVETTSPLCERNPHHLTLEVITTGEGGGIRNLGYDRGILVEEGKNYLFTCWYRLRGKGEKVARIRLEDSTGRRCHAQKEVCLTEREWSRLECVLTAESSDEEARLAILSREPVTLELDYVSLFPEDTFLGRKNGMRKDIACLLQDMRPRFVRFPGGCLTHIGSLDREDRAGMYRWKNTIGPTHCRPARRNTWNYNQTLGLGFYELFQFCEDIGAEPLPVIAAGYDPHSLRSAPLDDMQEWIDEALDLIEFANGTPESRWGSVRAKLGHPESFHLKYLAIGNEEVGDDYFVRYEIMEKAIHQVYPQILLINSAGPGSAGSEFEKGWKQAGNTHTAYVDEHFYQCPEWFLANADRYLSYPQGPGAFLGEYASEDDTWKNALAEAAFMTGMEKAPIPMLACYAPLLNHAAYTNWHPDLITFNNHQAYGSPSYHVQKLFMRNQGEDLLLISSDLPEKEKREPELSGFLAFVTERARVDIGRVIYRDEDAKEERVLTEGFHLNGENSGHRWMGHTGTNFSLSFSFTKRNGGRAENLEGRCSFELEFAGNDEQNKLFWRIDGWQRLTSLNGMLHGKTCDMGHALLETEVGRTYQAELRVCGGRVSTFLDGVLVCEYICRTAEPEPLYYSAVKDENGDLIVKAVNAEEEEKELILCLDDKGDRNVEITEMAGYDLDDRNSFEQPFRVAPEYMRQEHQGGEFHYLLKGYSVTVFRFSYRNAQKDSDTEKVSWKQTESGTTFFLNGREVLRADTPEGVQDYFEWEEETDTIRWERRTEKKTDYMTMEAETLFLPEHTMIPAVSYDGNPWGKDHEYKGSGENGAAWTFASHRCAVPGATCSWNETAGIALFSQGLCSCSLSKTEGKGGRRHSLIWPETEGPRVLYGDSWKPAFHGSMEKTDQFTAWICIGNGKNVKKRCFMRHGNYPGRKRSPKKVRRKSGNCPLPMPDSCIQRRKTDSVGSVSVFYGMAANG